MTAVTIAESAPRAPIATVAADSATDLLRVAIERGTPVEQLRELVALQEKMEERHAVRAFAAALVRFQQKCPRIFKDKTANITTEKGTNFSYDYAPLDHIAVIVNPLLADEGLSYNWDTTVTTAGMLTCICTLRHEAGHAITSSFTLPTENKSAMSPQQKVGAAASFAQRRTLSNVLGITTTGDDPSTEAADPTPITADQVTHIEDILAGKMIDVARFVKYMGVESVREIRAADYKKAEAALVAAKDRSREREGV